MSIEFRCSGCSKLLRTPDEAAGKMAKCPACGTILDVPAATPPGPAPDAAGPERGGPTMPSPFAAPSVSPFADATAGTRPVGGTDSSTVNPYASPMTSAATDYLSTLGSDSQAELRHTVVDFGEVFSKTWQIFSANLGPCLLVGLVFLGAMIAMQVIGQIGGMVAGASGRVVAVIGFQVIVTAINVTVQTWMILGVLFFVLRLLRGQGAAVGDVFAIGPYFWRGLGIHVVSYLIFGGILLVCLLPALVLFIAQGGPQVFDRDSLAVILTAVAGGLVWLALMTWVYLRLYLALPLLLDRNAGVFASLRESDRFMRDNKLTAFLMTLVVTVLGGLFSCCTCYLGIIAFYPYVFLVNGLFYLMATGQIESVRPPRM